MDSNVLVFYISVLWDKRFVREWMTKYIGGFMGTIFAFSTSANEKFYDKGEIIFSDDGDVVGRVLKCLKVENTEDEVFYAYDIESTKDVYEKLEKGEMKMWRMEQCKVHPCYMSYVSTEV